MEEDLFGDHLSRNRGLCVCLKAKLNKRVECWTATHARMRPRRNSQKPKLLPDGGLFIIHCNNF